MCILADLIRDVAVCRKRAEDAAYTLSERRRLFDAENSDLIAYAAETKNCVADSEDKLRAAVLGASEEDVKATIGVGIRNVKRLEYEEAAAVQWAVENGFGALLKLNTKAFESAVKGIKPSFVVITEERQATIARDLSGVL